MSFMAGAICVMCGNGVHDYRGRVACDGCDLPTDCCLCPDQSQPATPQALTAGTAPPRLAERILAGGCRPAPFAMPDTGIPASALRSSHVIVADGVSIYASATRASGRGLSIRNLPSILPPRSTCFLEMRGAGGDPRTWGAYLSTLDLADRAVLARVRADAALRVGSAGAAAGGRWLMLLGLVVASPDRQPTGPVLLAQLCLDGLGRLVARPERPGRYYLSVSLPRLLPGDPPAGHERFKERYTRQYLLPLLTALAFLNCAGSTLEPLGVAQHDSGTRFERLRAQPFEELLTRASRPGAAAVDVAAGIVPGTFSGGQWRPEHRYQALGA